MTPRSRKPVMLAVGAFNSADNQKSFQSNFENLLEESGNSSTTENFENEIKSLDSMLIESPFALRSRSENDIFTANDNGLPLQLVSSSAPDSLTSNFKYVYIF